MRRWLCSILGASVLTGGLLLTGCGGAEPKVATPEELEKIKVTPGEPPASGYKKDAKK